MAEASTPHSTYNLLDDPMDLLDKVEQLELAADQLGFRWENTDQIMSQIHSECLEIEEHLHQDDATIDKEA